MRNNKSWNVLCWNIRWKNSNDKHLDVHNVIESSGCSIFCLQETKHESFDLSYITRLCPKKFDMFAYVPSVGNSGGICTIWMSSVFSGSVVLSEMFALGITFSSMQSYDVWTLLNFYGPCSGPNGVAFSNWFFDFDIPSGENWLLLGDFNFIRAPDNRNRGGGDADDMLLFNDFIRFYSLVELPI